MNRNDFWGEFFRWLLTALVYGFYIGSVFVYFRSDWNFLFTFEYWVSILSSTAFAFFLRWLWSDKGLEKRLENNLEISDKEKGKAKLITVVNSSNLTDELEKDINIKNEENKKQAWINHCDSKIKHLKRKSIFKLFRKTRLQKWKEEKEFISSDEFNLDIIRVTYYKYDIDEMMCSFYKQGKNKKKTRGNKNKKILNSYKTNIITFVSFAVLKAIEVFISKWSPEDVLILAGQIIVFTINIYTGYKLGKDFIDEEYSSDLTDDYVFLKDFLKRKGVVVE